jgi:methionyl aminopeptidase
MRDSRIFLHSQSDFDGMRRAGRLAADVLDFITPYVLPGVTTGHLDFLCHEFIVSHGAIPAPLGYHGYPKSICTSVNHVVCHGIPGPQTLSEGDILNLDVTVIVDGWHGDTSHMFCLPPVSLRAQKLVNQTRLALEQAIACVHPGSRLGDIGHAIQSCVQPLGFSIVRDYCGHGIGRKFHDRPSVLHYGTPGTGTQLLPGMFFTIEPMINAGKPGTYVLNDGWTVVTRDRSLSAQFEHTLGVTETGCEIFTDRHFH